MMTARPPVSIAMVAVGGYGFHYLRHLWDRIGPARGLLTSVVDPEAARSPAWDELTSRGVPVFDSLEDFHASGRHADLVVVSSPIHWHVPHAVTALAHGSDVLCEKPVAATVQEVAELAGARDATGRWVMVGYQWSFSAAVQAFRRDIARGRYGVPRRLRTLCCWPRDLQYYGRNGWAGKRRDRASGRWVLDSPANNAMAHFLHNLLFLVDGLGPDAAHPVSIEAETYRAFPIETYDTVGCRVRTGCGAEVLMYASHATARPIEPRFRVELEGATATFGEGEATIRVVDRAGDLTVYGSPDDTPQFHKLRVAIDAVHDRAPVICPPEAALWQTIAVNGIEESVPSPADFPDRMVQRDAAGRIIVKELAPALERCYEAAVLPSELGAVWAVPGSVVALAGYAHFPGGRPPDEDSP